MRPAYSRCHGTEARTVRPERIPIKGRVNAEFRAEFLNAFNTPWFDPVTGLGNDPDDYRVTSASGGREIQLVWRINW